MSVQIVTAVNVVLTLTEVLAGAAVMVGMWGGELRVGRWALFAGASAAAYVTGFVYPTTGGEPSHVIGLPVLLVMVVGCFAFYHERLRGPWAGICVTTVASIFYVDAFVAVMQSFQRVPALRALAPTGYEPIFVVMQLLLLTFYVALAVLLAERFDLRTDAQGQERKQYQIATEVGSAQIDACGIRASESGRGSPRSSGSRIASRYVDAAVPVPDANRPRTDQPPHGI